MGLVKTYILRTRLLSKIALYIRKIQKDISLYCVTTLKLLWSSKVRIPKVFYIGIPAHNNLGDLAQGICIRKWIAENYRDFYLVEIETNSLVNTRYSVLVSLLNAYTEKDIIIFQSGYTTTDLGGYADAMHKQVIKLLPKAKILMMPQTIFFKSKERETETSKVYSLATNMLYLARDSVSYKKAKEMFPNIRVMLFPDIVTARIGEKLYSFDRKGILFCCRNDGEKYYSDEMINDLIEKCSQIDVIEKTDTTKDLSAGYMVKNAEMLMNNEIEMYSKYKIIITDRYHGTIFSLAAGTPVVILKTTDHKVVTGADWFKGIYDDYVHVVDGLEDAYETVKQIYSIKYDYILEPVFKKEYYDKLKNIFEEATSSNDYL